MATLTTQEKSLLLTATKIRRLVKADIEKTANPAIMALIESIGPALASLGPKLVKLVKAIPPQAWGQIAHNLVEMLTNAAEASSKTVASKVVMARTKSTIASVEIALVKAEVAEAHELATRLVHASVQAVASHRKTPNLKLLRAVKLMTEAQTELNLLREFF